MQSIFNNILIAISSMPRQALIVFFSVLLLALFLLLIFCLCQAAKMGDDLDSENEAQALWLAAQQERNKP